MQSVSSEETFFAATVARRSSTCHVMSHRFIVSPCKSLALFLRIFPCVFSLKLTSIISVFLRGDWICTLCRDVEQPEVEYDCENVQMSTGMMPYGLSAWDQRVSEGDAASDLV